MTLLKGNDKCIDQIRTILNGALAANYDAIVEKIRESENTKRSSGLEGTFAKTLHEALSNNIIPEISTTKLGMKTHVPERQSGRVDAYIPAEKIALEYKAVRIPRTKPLGLRNAIWDIGQLAADYLRLKNAPKAHVQQGVLVAFVYGPLVDDAASDGVLYRHFHNMMFIDYSINKTRKESREKSEAVRNKAYRELGWHEPCSDSKAPDWVKCARVKSIGAIIIACT